MKSNPLEDLPKPQRFNELDYQNLEKIIEMVENNRDEELYTLLLLDDVSAELIVSLINKIHAETDTAILYVSHKKEKGLNPQYIFEL